MWIESQDGTLVNLARVATIHASWRAKRFVVRAWLGEQDGTIDLYEGDYEECLKRKAAITKFIASGKPGVFTVKEV
jgi:ribosomal protein S5